MQKNRRVMDGLFVLAAIALGYMASCGGGGGGGGGGDGGPGDLTLPGFPDVSFGTNGQLTTAVGTGDDLGYGMAIQGDGKIVVAGQAYVGTNYDFAVVRYNADGTPDKSFNGTGKVTTPIGTSNDLAYAVAIQADGKIVVAGYAYVDTTNDFAVVRYNADGSLDNTFGIGGKVTTAVGLAGDCAYAVAIQGDGKILLAGYSSNGADLDFAVVRYNIYGVPDINFGTNGKVTTSIGSSGDVANRVAVQSDGKIVLSGYTYNGTNYDFALVRYNADGSLDTNSFGTSGKVTTAIGSGDDYATGLAIQGDGKIVLVGRSKMGTYDNWSMARYNTDGSLDKNFGTNGKVTTDITASYELGPGNDVAEAVAIQGDGKIVAAGYYTNGLKKNFALVRYDADGRSLDSTFGTMGVVIQAIGTNDYAMAVALEGTSKIVVAGYSNNGTNNDFAVARYWQ